MSVQIGQKAPNLKVSKWVQGMDTNLDKQNDSIGAILFRIGELEKHHKRTILKDKHHIRIINKLVKYQKYDFIIIGAGLAGLSFAYEVAKRGKSVIILEKDKQIGGLSKTLNYKGFKFDYCAHRFHTTNDNLLNEIKSLVGPSFKKQIQKIREETVFNIGNSGKAGSKYLVQLLKKNTKF